MCSGAASKPIQVSGLLLMFSHFQLLWMGHSHLHLFHQARAWAAEAGAVPWPMPGGFCRPWGHKYSRDGGRGAAPARLSAIAGCPAPPAQGTLWGHQQWDGHTALKWHIFDDLLWQDRAGSRNAMGCVAGSSPRRDAPCSGWPGEQLVPCALVEPLLCYNDGW